MSRVVECVPNFSEGQHKEVIEAIANAIAQTDGCNLLDVDPGLSTNRTVYTFVGSPEAVVEGALNGARAASQLIDMTRHQGEHPRMGALDVCPFIPVKGVTMEDCVECAKEFGERLANELGVPVYLYGEAASCEERSTVPQVRSGEYEGLQDKLSKPEWKPDYGEPDFVPTWGATIVGARKFLIAYNINLLSTKEQAHRIALNIREQGRGSDQPGRLQKVQALGWYLEESNLAQVSVNITDMDVSPMHVVYEEICKDAAELNLGVVGSQIVGLVPRRAMLEAAQYYINKENLFILEEDQKIRLVINRLGLSAIGGFTPKDRIIEYMISPEREGPLVSIDLKDFVLTIGARSPAPGGGSVAALTSTLGAALGTMAGFLTYGNKKFADLDSKMRTLLPPLYEAMKALLPFVDADAAAFNEYMLACKLPHGNPEDEKLRDLAMEQGLQTAIMIPMAVAKTTNSVWPALKELAEVGNINCRSDMQVAAKSLETGVWGAYFNVLTNLDDIKEDTYKHETQSAIEEALKIAQTECTAILQILKDRKE